MSAPRSLIVRYAMWIAGAPRRTLAFATLVFIASGVLASRLELRTAISELLPSDDPGVVALMRTQKRMGDMSLLLVGVRSPDREANLRYAEALTGRLRALPPNVLQLATYHVRDITTFFEANKWLYVAEADLEEIRDRIRREISKKKNPAFVSLSDDEPVEELKERLTKQDRLGGRFPGGVFSDASGEHVWIAALPPGGLLSGERGGEGIYDAAKRLVAELDPRPYHAEMKVHVGGPIATAIANRQAVERDIVWVTLTCVAIVILSIWIYFRRVRSVPLIGLPALLGTAIAFAVAQLTFGYLNSSTAFLGSIIVGNGINYAIVFISRYEELRAAGRPAIEAIADTVDGTAMGTGVAAICASAAYASLMLTSFRGFFQFGVMGAAGVVACWIAAFTLLPALLALLDGHEVKDLRAQAPRDLAWLGRLLARRSGTVLVASTVITAIAIPGVVYFASGPFEYDFRKLNTRLNTTEEAKSFNGNMDKLFGRWPSPTVILADEVGQVEQIRQAIRRNDEQLPGRDMIGRIVTVNDLLPGTAEVQARKLALLEEIRRLKSDKALELASEAEKKALQALDLPSELRALTPTDLPPLARRPFTEVDGTVGRVVLAYPAEKGFSIWDGRALLRIAQVLQRLDLGGGQVLETSGSAVVFGSMIRSVLRDGPKATALSLLAVVVLALVIMRPPRAALGALAALLVGVVWMVGGAGLAQVKITFLNFIALPITFGIGIEYALNVLARDREHRDMVSAVSSTGAAVALCSWTTIVGYGSLLAAQNQALRGFGAMSIIGEVTCLAAALVATPAFLLWWRRRAWKGRGTAADGRAAAE